MKNFVQPGSQLTVPAPATVLSGAGVLVGSIFGVANSAAASGADVVLSVTGVFDLPKAGVALTVGAPVYWDNTAKNLTTDDNEGENPKIGVAVAAAGSGVATGRVRLNGAF